MGIKISQTTQDKMKHNLGTFLLYFLVVYTFIMLGRSVWTNWQLQRQIAEIDANVVSIQKQNKDLENLILYYQSDSFREVEARRKLGLKKPDETVVNVEVKKFTDYNTEMTEAKENISENTKTSNGSNLSLWWQYFIK